MNKYSVILANGKETSIEADGVHVSFGCLMFYNEYKRIDDDVYPDAKNTHILAAGTWVFCQLETQNGS